MPELFVYFTVAAVCGADWIGTEILGRPTDDSITVNAIAEVRLDALVEYGLDPAGPWSQTPVISYNPGDVVEVQLNDLAPNTRHFYRVVYCSMPDCVWIERPVRTFHTRREPGDAFRFGVQADSHLQDSIGSEDGERLRGLYANTMALIEADAHDLLFDLGDTFQTEIYSGIGNASTYQQALRRYHDQRSFFGVACHSSPLFLVLGNHESEQGWRFAELDPLASWSETARLATYPNPDPATDAFYSGNTDGKENYYAFSWGDALFVALDPYRYTMTKPHHNPAGDFGSGERWDWTLGAEQYQWLVDTLEGSAATFKFVFSHQVTGGVNLYGRGGIEAASDAVGGFGSYEWGGENQDGSYGFDVHRPGWSKPIHDLLRDTNVAIFFHAHDHSYAQQLLDGVVYHETPQPSDATYGPGFRAPGRYTNGVLLNNSGYLRVSVDPRVVVVEYVRSFLHGEGPNGSVAETYAVTDCNANGRPDRHDTRLGSMVCPDFTRDGSIDLLDFATFATCFALQLPGNLDCICADTDGNDSIDLVDFATFSLCFGASQTQ
ncbi:MAG: metallophosphoesterase family protein [bacterium]|nr:metallophosphoesterase family protein [bacterium]